VDKGSVSKQHANLALAAALAIHRLLGFVARPSGLQTFDADLRSRQHHIGLCATTDAIVIYGIMRG
jgi:hypothetical protein